VTDFRANLLAYNSGATSVPPLPDQNIHYTAGILASNGYSGLGLGWARSSRVVSWHVW
jgi:hypothetical protein